MLVRNTTSLFTDLFLIKLGDTCRYLVRRDDKGLILIDPGASAHLDPLLGRIRHLGFDPADLKGILLTHTHYDRMAAAIALKKAFPSIELAITRKMSAAMKNQELLEMEFAKDQQASALYGVVSTTTKEDWKGVLGSAKEIDDGFQLPLGGSRFIRAISAPGHTNNSYAYLVFPYGCLIADETFGYFNGNKLAAPGGNYSLTAASTSVAKFLTVEVGVLALPYDGALTGSLVAKHLQGILQNSTDLVAETRAALADRVPQQTIEQSILDSFYLRDSRDPFLRESLRESFSSVYAQLDSIG